MLMEIQGVFFAMRKTNPLIFSSIVLPLIRFGQDLTVGGIDVGCPKPINHFIQHNALLAMGRNPKLRTLFGLGLCGQFGRYETIIFSTMGSSIRSRHGTRLRQEYGHGYQ